MRPNPNVRHAGVLHGRVLTVALEAKESLWRPDGPGHPPVTIAAFSEVGSEPLMPGPLLRAPAGTELRISVRNSLRRPLTFFVPQAVRGGPDRLAAMDSVVVAPGAVGRLSVRATVPGNYVYRAVTTRPAARVLRIAGLLAGGLVVDSADAATPPHDRVFVMMATLDSVAEAFADTAGTSLLNGDGPGRVTFTINGRSWPETERIAATVGDSLHWRIINANGDLHPMHLHGFYYRIDSYAGPFADLQGRPAPGEMAVTQLMTSFAGMSMTWSPVHRGNWIFHCHFALHLMPDSISAAPDDPHMRGMVGLVLAVNVADRAGAVAARMAAAPPARRLRLVAIAGQTGTAHDADSIPPMRFVLEENGRRTDTRTDFSPELDLVRDQPVSITIVNRLDEPTSIHWHGVEIEDSYVDGVPGVSGDGRRLTPAIAPGDSFVAAFTPPRSGTFMYHAHVDDVREQMAGLVGTLIVRDPGTSPSPDDHVFFLKGLAGDSLHPLEIDGRSSPDTVVLHVGRTARLRLANLSTANPIPTFSLSTASGATSGSPADNPVVRWRPVAKDGFDLPAAARMPRAAHQVVSIGETYDFEFTPRAPGAFRLSVRTTPPAGARARSRLLVGVPIRVE